MTGALLDNATVRLISCLAFASSSYEYEFRSNDIGRFACKGYSRHARIFAFAWLAIFIIAKSTSVDHDNVAQNSGISSAEYILNEAIKAGCES